LSRILVLNEEVANQIAAGEVVERPASVVKELVENALDAGATTIDVQIKQGGLEQIIVSDNGSGMEPDDLPLAFLRHATSKLRQSQDLFGIKTLGFRGEALPSIASVAKVQVITRQADAAAGWQLTVNGGEVGELSACGAPVGTTVVVNELFYNTPARKSFMKSPPAEAGRIRELMTKMALAAPQVALRLRQDDRIVLETTGNNVLRDVILAIYGRETCEQLIAVDGSSSPVQIAGLIGRPELTRNNRRDQVFILNGRLVQCRSLSAVLGEAYRSLLPRGRYPVAFLHLTLPPESVDVNVHPAKIEVRLRDERQVAAVLHRVLRQALSSSGQEQAAATARMGRMSSGFGVQESLAQPMDEPIGSVDPALRPDIAAEEQTPLVPVSLQQVKQQLLGVESDWSCPYSSATGPMASEQPPGHVSQQDRQVSPPQSVSNHAYRLLGQALNSYLAVEREDGFWLVDQHAAHERIIYEQLSRAEGSWQTVQQLLVPYSLQAAPQEAAVLEQSEQELRDLGFDLQHFGGNTWLLRSLPQIYRGRFSPDQFRNLISDLADDWRTMKTLERREQLLIRLSCQGAIKAGQRMHNSEMIELLDQLWQTALPFTCPHGRPTAIRFSREQLFRMFHP
jgi:DNA mismatch repair protein MutL